MNTVKHFYFYLSDISRKLQENSYFPEYSGISLIPSIERVSPGKLIQIIVQVRTIQLFKSCI